jgi:phosphoglucosamine mutase
VLSELDAEVFAIGTSPNGRNINEGCGSTSPETVIAKVRELRADVGIALDGDGDRCMLVDEKGNSIDGDALLAVSARDMAERGTLRGGGVVATVMSNLGLERALERIGVRLVRTAVGDRYVVEEMRAGGYNLGGEQSGHILYLDHTTTGDGLITALAILAVMRSREQPLSTLASVMQKFPQVLINVPVREKRDLEQLPAVQTAVQQCEAALAGRGRVYIRYSGTEALARVMVEGQDLAQVESHAAAIAEALQAALGATARALHG